MKPAFAGSSPFADVLNPHQSASKLHLIVPIAHELIIICDFFNVWIKLYRIKNILYSRYQPNLQSSGSVGSIVVVEIVVGGGAVVVGTGFASGGLNAHSSSIYLYSTTSKATNPFPLLPRSTIKLN